MSQCQCCGISIGKDFIETKVYQVGEFEICGWCHAALQRRGRMQLVRAGEVRRWLYPDGSVKSMKEKREG